MTNNSENMVLSKSQFISIIIGAIVGTGFLVLPSGLTKVAHQDGWISAILGSIYPLIFIILSSSVIKKYPNDNILSISKKCFGKVGGSIYNFIYLTFCIFIGSNVNSGYSNLMRAYVVPWISPLRLMILCTIVVAYAAFCGLKTVGKVCEIAVAIIIILVISPVQALRVSSLINIKPVLGSGLKAIINGVQGSLLSYSGIELMLFFHPYVKEKKYIKWYSTISVIFVMLLYTWGTFISIFYLSPDIVSKSQWPFLLATQSVTIAIINNFSYFFILMWGIIGMRCIMIYYYVSITIIKDFLPRMSKKWICLILYGIFLYFSLKMGNEINRRAMVDGVIKVYTIINFVALILFCIILKLKKDENISKRNWDNE